MTGYDPKFTQSVVDAIGPKASPRTRQVMSALIRHLHDFAREVDLNFDEWMMGVKFINSVGQASSATRNEAHRVSDILGLETLVDEISNKLALQSDDIPTSTTILGPFWSPHAPFRENGDTIVRSPHNGEVALMHGRVTDLVSKKPIANAVVDIWEASSSGKYDFQEPDVQEPNNLRGKFRTDKDGYYHFYCLKPTAYSLPTDGPSYELLTLLDRHPMRPAHIHLMISHPEYRPVITQIFPDDDPYVKSDTVFAVKDDLVVSFKPRTGDPKAKLDLEYNIVLAPKGTKTVSESKL
ncbi:hypothetical protein VTN00DRAFT_3281 [Thermoascus crustaceus]|uniref:uncharacterized protein n=1 Tax=Thermoascus crustaceus TaxID=5088 RepID=UPI00374436C3